MGTSNIVRYGKRKRLSVIICCSHYDNYETPLLKIRNAVGRDLHCGFL